MSLELLKDLKGLVSVPLPSASHVYLPSRQLQTLGRTRVSQGLLPRKTGREPHANTSGRQWDGEAAHLRTVVAVVEVTVALPSG